MASDGLHLALIASNCPLIRSAASQPACDEGSPRGGNQRHSEAIRGTHRPSKAIGVHHRTRRGKGRARAPCLARARLLSGLSKVMMRHMLPLVFNWREQGAGEGAVLGKGAAAL